MSAILDFAAHRDHFVMYRCRECNGSALNWPEEIAHLNQQCRGKRPESGLVDLLVLAPVAVERGAA